MPELVQNLPTLIVLGVLFVIVVAFKWQQRAAKRAVERERLLKAQMQRFASITARLVGGDEIRRVCHDLAPAIVLQSSFAEAAILLADDAGKLTNAGSTDAATATLALRAAAMNARELADLCAGAESVGHGSYRAKCGEPPAPDSGDEFAIPLRSRRGAMLGCIWLRAAHGCSQLAPEDLTPIEMVASHIAAALEQSRLQGQLLVSEKLASLGQLITGLTHELNNPLSVVLGYCELLLERPLDEATRRDLTIVQREGSRMKRILQNLARFAQTSPHDRGDVSVSHLLQEVLSLREYEGRTRNVQIITDLASDLPRVPFDAELLKQVFFNLINNALDAVEKSLDRRISIAAQVVSERLVMQFSDTGPGFRDLNRVFDPFFTTREVGHGTGLGLSVCFGILKQHGGDIYARNIAPRGGCVVLELPLSRSGISLVGHATGKMAARNP
jgi:signal transduction histidine kinase